SKVSVKPGELVRALERRVLVRVAPVPPAKVVEAPAGWRMPPVEEMVREEMKLAEPPVVVKAPPSVRKRRWPVAGSYSKSALPSPGAPIVVAEATTPRLSVGLAERAPRYVCPLL